MEAVGAGGRPVNVIAIRTGVEELLKCAFLPVQKGPWTAAQFLRTLNSFQNSLFIKIAGLNDGFFEDYDYLDETSGQSIYNFPTTLFKIVMLERIIGGGATAEKPLEIYPLQRTAEDALAARGMATATLGLEFYEPIAQKTFRLVPASTQTVTGSLRLRNVFKPADLVNDTDVPFQKTNGMGGAGKDSLSEWHDVLMLGVAERLCKANKEIERAQMFQSDRMEREQELAALLKPTMKQRPRYPNYMPSLHDELWT